MRARLLAILVGLLVFATRPIFGTGNTSAAFLRLGMGGRNAAMGETGAAQKDPYSTYWNPAGLAGLKSSSLSFMHAAWLSDISFQNLVYAQRLDKAGIAVSATYLSIPEIAKYDRTGALQSDTYKPADMMIGISYAREYREMPLGATLKYISSQIDGHAATAVAIDAGIQIKPVMLAGRELRAGAAVQNLGTQMKFINESSGLPLNFKIGAEYSATNQITGALDLNKPIDADIIANVGLQYLLSVGSGNGLAFRAGYRSNTKGLDGLAGFTAGLGFGFEHLQVDYAFVPYGNLDNTHRISLTYNF